MANGPAWANARVLVDSGSEHPPLISQTMADRLGLAGPISGEETQAAGAFLPLRDVGNVDLVLNNKVVTQIFLSTPLSHYDVILGEPWLQDNTVIMDYAHNVLWQWNNGVLTPVTFGSHQRNDPFAPAPEVQARDLQYKIQERATMMSQAIATGMWHATMTPVDRQSEIAHIENTQAWEHSVFTSPLERWLLGMEDYQSPHTGARSCRQEARHFLNGEFRRPGVHMIGDVAKELPEDAELENLVDMDIPGLVAPGERSFHFVESEVRDQLSHLSLQKQDVIVGILEEYEPMVFENREMPRLAPHRNWDLDITEIEGARPQAGQPYLVAPQHLPELNRQIAVLERAGVIRRS